MKQSPLQQEGREFCVLVVDDDQDIAESAREVIEHMVPHCRVETADSCQHALAAMEKRPMDAMLVDYRMPHQTGLDFIRSARGLDPHVPAILMTAYGSIELAMTAVNGLHIDGFLAKPINALQLAGTVESALRRSAGGGTAGILPAEETPVPDDIQIHW